MTARVFDRYEVSLEEAVADGAASLAIERRNWLREIAERSYHRAAMNRVSFTVLGEPASKSNSRKIVSLGGKKKVLDGESVRVGGRIAVIKSEKALQYAKSFARQIPSSARQMYGGPIKVTMTIYYADNRSDLDEQLILDCMQPRYMKVGEGERAKRVIVDKGVYVNDRQIVERHVYKRIDKSNPRTEIEVVALAPQALELELGAVASAADEEAMRVLGG